MKILLIGGGGREHALAWKITQSPLVRSIAVTADNAGFPQDALRVQGDPVDYAVTHGVDLVVVGPEAPLADGIVDRLSDNGIRVFGPTKAAAQLESSKSFAKAFMARHAIPTAKYGTAEDAETAHALVHGPCVVKADGLAAGKGVFVCDDADEAHASIDTIFEGAFGQAGHRVVVEERLQGPELSVLAICDGRGALTMLPCRDHKRRHVGDRGPNTGGMGAICSAELAPELAAEVERTVIHPTVAGMAAEGMPFRGILYAGMMLTPDGPKVLEFNVRFGNPECQPLMMMMAEDIVPLFVAAADGALPDRSIAWKTGAAATVVMVAGGYPGPYDKGMLIEGTPTDEPGRVVFFAGARRDGDRVVTSGGRVLGVTAYGESVTEALTRAYEWVQRIQFSTADFRNDIGGFQWDSK